MLSPGELRHRHKHRFTPWKATHGCRFHAKTYSSERNPTGELPEISIMSWERSSCWLNCCCWNWFLNGTVETQLVIITEYQNQIFIPILDGSRWISSINSGVLLEWLWQPLCESTKKKICATYWPILINASEKLPHNYFKKKKKKPRSTTTELGTRSSVSAVTSSVKLNFPDEQLLISYAC